MKILLMGATGLSGQSFLTLALAHPTITQVIAPTRRPLPRHPKLQNVPLEEGWWDRRSTEWQAEAYVGCLGTTLRKAGSRAAFRQVDFEGVCRLGDWAQQHGARSLSVVSSLGASSRSRNFYLRTKGEMEAYLTKLNLPSLTLVQPSILIGGTRPEFRLGERLAQVVLQTLRPLLPGAWQPTPITAVGQALLTSVLQPRPGTHRILSKDLHALL